MSASAIPLFGIAYELKVLTPADAAGNQQLINYSTSSWEPEALRITFEVNKQFGAQAWTADIGIYNLNPSSQQNAIQVGSQVILSAGFQVKQNYGIIFQGIVLQPTWEKINSTDYRVGLNCITGINFTNTNLISTNLSRNASQADFVRRMAAQATAPFQTDLMDFSAMDQRPLPRGQMIFGDVGGFLDEVARDNEAQFWVAGDRPGYAKLSSDLATATPDITYAPPLPVGGTFVEQPGTTYSIIGTPQQTQYGVNFTVLLDPRVDFVRSRYLIVDISQSQIRQASLEYGSIPPVPFEQSGRYYVFGIRHVGDSRGNDWETEITAVTNNALQQLTGTA